MVKKRGSTLAYKIFIYNYKLWGYTVMSVSLHFVVLYYALTSKDIYGVLKEYYAHLNQHLTPFLFYRHLHSYALSLFDRFASLIKPKSFTFLDEVGSAELFQDGGIMVLSHFGGWGTIINAFERQRIPKITVVMNEVLDAGTSAFEESLSEKESNATFQKIDLSQGMQSQIRIANALLNNELVAMMADRVVNESKRMTLPFLNENADFPTAPYELAFKFNKKVFAVFNVRTGRRTYTLFSKELCYDAGTQAETATQQMAASYVKHLEDFAKTYPQQWYNLYNFWRPSC